MLQTLTPDECRALGPLIEKALTTPAQYPLSLNGLIVGINQKSNRDPVIEIDEARVLRAVDGLAAKSLARAVSMSSGARVEKFRHIANESLGLRAPELSILCELLLRGPQTTGELRSRASRMHHYESMETVENILQSMSTAVEGDGAASRGALVREIPAVAGERTTRWMQLLHPTLHPLHISEASSPATFTARAVAEPSEIAALTTRVSELERVVEELKRAIESR